MSASIPLFPIADNLTKYRYSAHQLKKSYLEKSITTDEVMIGLESAFYNFVSSAHQVKATEKALEYSQLTYDQMEERFRQGLISSNDLLSMDTMLKAAKTNLLTSRKNFVGAKSDIQKLLSFRNEEELFNLLYTN